MKRKKIIKGNEIIAKFMISKKGKKLKVPGCIYRQDINDGLLVEDSLDEEDYESFKYHSSWDWLMPVVEKINTLLYPNEDDGYADQLIEQDNDLIFDFQNAHYFGYRAETLKDIYNKCITFIKWYNKNK